jgi:hypothetical protein
MPLKYENQDITETLCGQLHVMENTRSRNSDTQTQQNNATMDQVADNSTKVSLETLLTEIPIGNDKLSKEMMKISDDVKNFLSDMTELGKCMEEAKTELTMDKIK